MTGGKIRRDKKCKFCGSNALRYKRKDSPSNKAEWKGQYVVCSTCGVKQ